MKPIIKKHERIFIWVKDCNEYTVLAIVAAIQAYESDGLRKHEGFCSLRRAQADFKMEIDLALPMNSSHYADIFRKLVPSVKVIWFNIVSVPFPEDYDCIFDLEESKARAIGQTTGKHIANSYGILLGSEADSLPKNVGNICQGHAQTDRIITSVEFLNHADWLGIYLPANKLMVRTVHDTIEERIKQSFECDGVLDFSCFESYLASCLHKKVIEVNPDPQLTKWSSPNYYLLETLSHDALFRGIKVCFPHLIVTT